MSEIGRVDLDRIEASVYATSPTHPALYFFGHGVEYVRALCAELRALREVERCAVKDTGRLDWLEAEMEHEQREVALGLNPAPPLFRANLPITRAMIDAAMEKGKDNHP